MKAIRKVRHSSRQAALVAGILASFLMLTRTTMPGQVSTASINGTVRDSQGAVMPQAKLVLQNLETGVERHATTNPVGNYVFLNISPGHYILQASSEGFRTSTVQPFTLEVNQTATFNFRLEVGAVEQTITVEATGSEVQASTAELGSVMAEQQVLDLPLNGRNFTQLLTLTPGASPVSVGQNSGGGQAVNVGSVTYPSVNGQSNRSNNFMTDGTNNTGVFMSTYAVPPIIDAIQEFKVQSHNDQAEFGMATGATVNVVTKSGTNEFHGSVWEFMRNDALDARNFFRSDVTPLRQNMFGGTLGGPILRNKTFFFVGYQGFARRTPANHLYRVPTEANLRGDLSDWPRQIFNPFTTREDPNRPGALMRDPFPGNQIPASMLDPGLLVYSKTTLPAPIQTGVADRNQLDLTPQKQDQYEYTARIDHNFGEKDFVFARGSGSIFNQDSSAGRQTLQSFNDTNSMNIGGSWVHTFNPTSILQVQAARTVVERDQGNAFIDLPDNFLQEVGFDPQFVGFRSGFNLVPNMSVSQFFSGGESDLYARPSELVQFKGNYSKILGKHQIKLGGEFNEMDYRRIINDHNSNFDSDLTSDPRNPGTTGSPLASFLLNLPNAAGRRDFNKTTRFGGVFGFYFQDSWKFTPRLTVNLGLRYDYTMIPPLGKRADRTIFMGNLDLIRGLYILQAVPGACADVGEPPCLPSADGSLPDHVIVDPREKLLQDYTDNWQPRVGFAYRVNDKTAIRASFGMFFDNWAGMMQATQNLGHTWPDIGRRLESNINKPTVSAPTPTISGKNPFPEVGKPAADPFSQGAYYQDPFFQDSYSMQWNFGVQHQLRSDTMIAVNYVGSGNRRLPLGGFYNVATPGAGNAAPRREYPYIKPTNFDKSWGRSNYNALQFQFRKRYTHGFAYTLNYTWSKSIDIGCSGFFGVEGCAVQDPIYFNNDRSVAGADIPHMLNINWVYELPVGPGKAFQSGSGVVDQIIGNWQINGIATFRSGQVYTVNINGDIANTGNKGGYMRPNLIGDPVLSNPTPERWINTDAFAVPAPFTFGSAGRNILRADGRANFDLSVFRQFPLPLREGTHLEFRAEAFNAFNSTKFNAPVSNLSNSNFGKVLSAGGERQIQLGLKLVF